MNLSKNIKEALANAFMLDFDVSLSMENREPTYNIKPHGSEDQYFYIKAEVKNDTRLTIICEPEKYAADFVHLLGSTNEEKQNIFCDYWKVFEEKGCKVSIRINDIEATKESFHGLIGNCKKFFLRITKSPYFNEENEESKDTVVVNNITSVCAMMLSLFNYEIDGVGYEEGKKYKVELTKYERNPINRKLCLLAHGYRCKVCGLLFEEKYGNIGKDYIEVHHLKPVSQVGPDYKIDPINDLVPICSNCHSMVHRRNPPFTVEELKEILK